MTKGEIEYAKRQAFNSLDKWVDSTGVIPKHTGYYYELMALLEEAIHIGAQIALNGDIERNGKGEILKTIE